MPERVEGPFRRALNAEMKCTHYWDNCSCVNCWRGKQCAMPTQYTELRRFIIIFNEFRIEISVLFYYIQSL